MHVRSQKEKFKSAFAVSILRVLRVKPGLSNQVLRLSARGKHLYWLSHLCICYARRLKSGGFASCKGLLNSANGIFLIIIMNQQHPHRDHLSLITPKPGSLPLTRQSGPKPRNPCANRLGLVFGSGLLLSPISISLF